MELKTLSLGDEDLLERFLAPRAASSMFLRANSRAAGLIDRGGALEGTYVAALVGNEIASVAAHFWNGMLVLQAPETAALEAVARAAVSRSGRELSGLAGPRAQVEAARRALGAESRRTSLDSREILFSLELAELRVPEGLASGRLSARRPENGELALVASWRADYLTEALGLRDGKELRARARTETARVHGEGSHWILFDNVFEKGRPVSYSAFNARLPDTVQVGGVWTPRELRGRGYARAVVAASLLEARAAGVRSSLLFTDEENRPAITAYGALGFRPIGDYGLVMFE
jgi:uncharacterized protein